MNSLQPTTPGINNDKLGVTVTTSETTTATRSSDTRAETYTGCVCELLMNHDRINVRNKRQDRQTKRMATYWIGQRWWIWGGGVRLRRVFLQQRHELSVAEASSMPRCNENHAHDSRQPIILDRLSTLIGQRYNTLGVDCCNLNSGS